MFARHGVEISRQTMQEVQMHCCPRMTAVLRVPDVASD